MKLFLNISSRLLVAVFAVLVFVSCNDPNELGAEFVPLVNVVADSVDVEVYSTKSKTFRTDFWGGLTYNGGTVNQNLSFGTISDPHFGKLEVGTYLELVADDDSSYNLGGTDVVVDSAILFIRMNSLYGRATEDQQLIVNLLQDSLKYAPSTAQRQNLGHNIDDYSVGIGTTNYAENFTFSFPDSVDFQDTSRSNVYKALRVNLDTDIGYSIINNYLSDLSYKGINTSNGFDSLNRAVILPQIRAIRSIFPGLYISSAPVDDEVGAIFTITTEATSSATDTTSTKEPLYTRLDLYITYTDTVNKDSLGNSVSNRKRKLTFATAIQDYGTTNFEILTQRYYSVTRSGTDGKLVEDVENGVKDFSARNIFIQDGLGYNVVFSFPSIKESKPELPQVVNRATLTFTVDTTYYQTDDEKQFLLPKNIGQLRLYEVTSSVDDFENRFLANSESFSVYDSVKQTIVFNITSIITDDWFGQRPTDGRYVIRWSLPGTVNSFGRAIFCGNGHPVVANRPKLKVYYTTKSDR